MGHSHWTHNLSRSCPERSTSSDYPENRISAAKTPHMKKLDSHLKSTYLWTLILQGNIHQEYSLLDALFNEHFNCKLHLIFFITRVNATPQTLTLYVPHACLISNLQFWLYYKLFSSHFNSKYHYTFSSADVLSVPMPFVVPFAPAEPLAFSSRFRFIIAGWSVRTLPLTLFIQGNNTLGVIHGCQ